MLHHGAGGGGLVHPERVDGPRDGHVAGRHHRRGDTGAPVHRILTGAPGAAGPAGGEGTPGENGKYYVPNKETGCFDIYQDGKLVEATDIS